MVLRHAVHAHAKPQVEAGICCKSFGALDDNDVTPHPLMFPPQTTKHLAQSVHDTNDVTMIHHAASKSS